MSTDAEFTDSLVKVIRKHRIAKKLSMYELAKIAKLDKSALGKLEAGMRAPSVITVHKIARALQIPLWRLIKESEKSL